jgi:hypothetical protein
MDRVVEIDPTYAKAYLVRASAHAKLGLTPRPGSRPWHRPSQGGIEHRRYLPFPLSV